jgi:hypothetical protein
MKVFKKEVAENSDEVFLYMVGSSYHCGASLLRYKLE